MKKSKILLCGFILLQSVFISSCASNTGNDSVPNSDKIIFSETNSSAESGDHPSESYTEIFNFGCAMNLLTGSESNNGYVPIDTQILEYSGTPMEFVLVTSAYSDYLPPNGLMKMRTMVMQDGELLEHSLEKEGKPTIYNDVYVTPNVNFYTSIYFKPLCNYEYSAVTVICEYLPDDIPKAGTGEYCGTVAFSKLIKTPANTASHTEMSTANYETLPEKFQDSDGVTGVAIGAKLNAPTSYRITDNHGAYEDITLSEKEIFLKANINSDKTHYAMILCDGVPVRAFGGKYTLPFNCKNGTRTLNEKIKLPDGLTDGIHVFQAVVVEHNMISDQIDTVDYITNKIRININSSLN